MATKRVLVFSLAYYPFVGGAEVALREIVERLAGDEYEFEIITVNLDGNQPAIEKYVWRWCDAWWWCYKISFPVYCLSFSKRLHQREPYDVVWAMMANQAGLATLFLNGSSRKLTFADPSRRGFTFDIWLRTWFMRPLYKAIYKRAEHIQRASNFLAKGTKFGAKCPVTVVPMGGCGKFQITNSKSQNKEEKSK